jgi:hypothetical protein
MTQAQKDFIAEYARLHLVDWCAQTLIHGHMIDMNPVRAKTEDKPLADLCFEFALEKGWVTKSDPVKVSAKGFSTAAAFLKR